MKVAIAQMDCQIRNVAANVETMAGMIVQAAQQACDVVLFPEMADTGFEMSTIRDYAGSWEDGPCRDLRRLAGEHGIAVIAGLSDRCGEGVRNGAAVIDKRGELIADYRKIHLFSNEPFCEDKHFGAGDRLCLFELCGWPCGLVICYDIRFPELPRALAVRGAEVMFVMAAWPPARIQHWKLLNAARAVENQLYVVAANRAGSDGDILYGGSSCVVDPLGETTFAGDGVELLVTELSRERVAEVRRSMLVYKDRRPELYRQWYCDDLGA